MKLCTQILTNKFTYDLHRIYEIPVVAEMLPSIETFKIASNGKEFQDIAKSVKHEIKTRGYCDILNSRPIVLSMLCVGSFVEYLDLRVQKYKPAIRS